ncbi:MAG: hypothetical protein KDA41_22320 [Planctomycetales bacterium]|nr:hypothetical protein [Planctomycetales bacterium]
MAPPRAEEEALAAGADLSATPSNDDASPGEDEQPVGPVAAKIGSEYESSHGEAAPDEEKYPPVFQDWPKPLLTLYFTGRQHGYIEPCGCTGLANQKGGLSRRHVLLKKLAEQGWNPVPIDVGNQVRRFGRQPEIKFQTTVAGLKKIGYQAIGFGPDDLRLSSGELLSAALGTDGTPAPFVCANVNLLGQTPTLRVIEAGGKKIGVTAILGREEQRSVSSDEIELSDPDTALEKVVPKLEAEKCDLYVLLAHTSIEESKRLGKKFPLFDLVVTAGSAGEPSNRLEPIEGSKGRLVQIGAKGMYVSVVGVFDDAETPLRLQRTPLDGRYGDSSDMLDLMASYQQQLEAVGLEGLGVRPLDHPSGHKFVGSAACADCHEREYDIWKNSPHAHATDAIVHPKERGHIQRHFDPECLSCHVTGWNPQEHHPWRSGYLNLDESKKLTQSGCENCHGPGSAHAAAENGEIDGLTDAQIEQLREGMRLKLSEARDTCLKCHDLDNSPNFHLPGAFEEYWKRIAH